MEETLTSIGVLKGNIRRNIKVYGERCGEVKIKRKVYLCKPKILCVVGPFIILTFSIICM